MDNLPLNAYDPSKSLYTALKTIHPLVKPPSAHLITSKYLNKCYNSTKEQVMKVLSE
jgi:hypothetical protein